MILLVLKRSLTYALFHSFGGQRIIESFGKFTTIPNKQLLIWHYVFDSVEVDGLSGLAGHQVLTFARIRRVNVAHPVGFGDVESVDVVIVFGSIVHAPEVFSVGIRRDTIFLVDVSNQGTKTSASGNVTRTPNTEYLFERRRARREDGVLLVFSS